jgi:hypothetical protein
MSVSCNETPKLLDQLRAMFANDEKEQVFFIPKAFTWQEVAITLRRIQD